jgi:serine protease Do
MPTPNERSFIITSIIGGIIGTLIVFALLTVIASSYPDQIRSFLLNTPSETSDPDSQGLAAEDQKSSTREQSIIAVVDQVSPAVVAVTLTKDIPIYKETLGQEFYDPFEEFFGAPSPFGDLFRREVPQREEVGSEKVEVGGGTGFLISKNGYIITNRHVVDRDDVEYSVITDDGESHAATVVAKDPLFDIAVLKIEGENHTFLTFGNSDEIEVGQTAIAIGNALAEFRNTVSVGVISGLSRSITAGNGLGSFERLEGVIQTDAAINPGNSGGPLLNLSGEVIGMNVAMAGAENIGFALPSNIVKKVAESVRDSGKIVRPFLGIRYIPITEELKDRNKLAVDHGVLIIRGETLNDLAVTPGSAADKAGIVENDIILELDGVRLDEENRLASLIRKKNVGDTIELKILHKGEEKTVRATLEAFPE